MTNEIFEENKDGPDGGRREKRPNTDCEDLDFVVWMEREKEKRGLLGFFFLVQIFREKNES